MAAYYGDPVGYLNAQLKKLEDENTLLRNKLFEAADENFNLQATVASIEVEAKYNASKEVMSLQSELNFKKNEMDQQRHEVSKLTKELQEARQKLLQQEEASKVTPSSLQAVPQSTVPKESIADLSHKHLPLDKVTEKYLQFLPILHKSLEQLLLSCSFSSSSDMHTMGAHFPPSVDIRTPNSGRNSRVSTPGHSYYHQDKLLSNLNSYSNSFPRNIRAPLTTSPFQPLVDEIEAMSTTILHHQTHGQSLNISTKMRYDPMALLQIISKLFKIVITVTLPFQSSATSSGSSSSTTSAPAASDITLPITVLIHYLQFINTVLAYFPWESISLGDLIKDESQQHRPGFDLHHHGNNSETTDRQSDDEDDGRVLTTSRVRSNLSQRFDRLRPTTSKATAINTSTMLSTLVSTTDPTKASREEKAIAYVSIVQDALQRVKIGTSSSTSQRSSEKDTTFSTANTHLSTVIKSSQSSSKIKTLKMQEVGILIENMLETLQDLSCRHVILLESNFEYRHASFQTELSQSMLESVLCLIRFMRQQSCYPFGHDQQRVVGFSKRDMQSPSIGRYLSTLFERLSMSRSAYHQALLSAPFSSSAATAASSSSLSSFPARGGAIQCGGSHYLSSKVFTMLSSSSMIWLLLQYTPWSTANKSNTTMKLLSMLCSEILAQDETCFTVFLRQQYGLLRLWQRKLASTTDITSGSPSNDTSITYKTVPIILFLIQEVCRVDTIYAPSSSATAPCGVGVTTSNATLAHNNNGNHHINSDRLPDSLPESASLLEETAIPTPIVAAATTTTMATTIGHSSTNAYAVDSITPVLNRSVLQSKLQLLQALLSLVRQWPDCTVAMILQIVPPQWQGHLAPDNDGGASSAATGSGNNNSNGNRDVMARSARHDGGGETITQKHSRSNNDVDENDEDDGLHRSEMTGVVVQQTLTSSTSTSSVITTATHNNRTSSSKSTTTTNTSLSTFSGSSSNDVTPIRRQQQPQLQRKRKRGAKQILEEILEEDEDDIEDNNQHKPSDSSVSRMDVDERHDSDDEKQTIRAGNTTDIQKTTGSTAAIPIGSEEEWDWKAFSLNSLHFEPVSSASASFPSSSSLSLIPLYMSPMLYAQSFTGHRRNDTSSTANTAAPSSANTGVSSMLDMQWNKSKQRVEAAHGHVHLAPYRPKKKSQQHNHNSQHQNNSSPVFDTSHLVGLCRLWMQLWQSCDSLPLERSLSVEREEGKYLKETKELLLEATRTCTRLLNTIIGVIGKHPQCRLLLRDANTIFTAFFFRDILNYMHPELALSSSDYDQLDALEG